MLCFRSLLARLVFNGVCTKSRCCIQLFSWGPPSPIELFFSSYSAASPLLISSLLWLSKNAGRCLGQRLLRHSGKINYSTTPGMATLQAVIRHSEIGNCSWRCRHHTFTPVKLQAGMWPGVSLSAQIPWVVPMWCCQSDNPVSFCGTLRGHLLWARGRTKTVGASWLLLIDGLPLSCPQEHGGWICWFFFLLLSAGKQKLSERKKTSHQLRHNTLHCQGLPPRMETHSTCTLYVLGGVFACMRWLFFVLFRSLPNSTLFWKRGNNQGDDANDSEAPPKVFSTLQRHQSRKRNEMR